MLLDVVKYLCLSLGVFDTPRNRFTRIRCFKGLPKLRNDLINEIFYVYLKVNFLICNYYVTLIACFFHRNWIKNTIITDWQVMCEYNRVNLHVCYVSTIMVLHSLDGIQSVANWAIENLQFSFFLHFLSSF